MRSSGSTRSRSPDGAPRLFLYVVGDDHPRACTGRRLLARGFATELGEHAPTPRGLLLDPHAERILAPPDARTIARGGLVAVDCSWNRLARAGRYAPGPTDRVQDRFRRRLPLLLAGNAHHYGRVAELNTAEALAAALWVAGFADQARELLSEFRDGESFVALNRERLEAYAAASDADALRAVEHRAFGGD